MPANNFLLIVGLFVGTLSYAQTVPCEGLAEKLRADTAQYVMNYISSFSPDTCYCLGKYFAKRDIEAKIFIIQTYGGPEWANPCTVCRYESYGYSFVYHGDIIIEHCTRFIEGYNEVSKKHLEKQLGDSAFLHIDEISEDHFNPKEVLSKIFETGKSLDFFTVDKINDTLINVKLHADSLFKEHPQFVPKVVYHIWEFNYKEKKRGITHTLDHVQFKETGFRLTERANNNYYLNISFDFKGMAGEEKLCWCASMEKWGVYSYVVPFRVE